MKMPQEVCQEGQVQKQLVLTKTLKTAISSINKETEPSSSETMHKFR